MNSNIKIELIHIHNTRQVENITFFINASINSLEKIYLYTEETVYG